MVLDGRVREVDRLGNGAAAEAADSGRRRVGSRPHQLECTGNLPITSWKMKLMGRRKDRMIKEKMVSKEWKME